MIKQLIIYDATGKIYCTMSGYEAVPEGLSGIIVEVPNGKIVSLIDTSVTPHVPVFEDVPLTDIEEKLQELQTSNDMLTDCVLEMSEIIYNSNGTSEEE